MITRRQFIVRSAVAASGSFGVPCAVRGGVPGTVSPAGRITVGCIGVGRMGSVNLGNMLARTDVQVVAVCDVDDRRLGHAQREVEARGSRGCGAYRDFRELLGRPDIDVVVISVPDHWHGLAAIEAATAGKDIFLEKPMTLTVREGRLLCEAVRRYGRVLTVNTWQRSDRRFHRACEWVRNGLIGRVHTVRIGLPCDEAGPMMPPMPIPGGLDYGLWQGPAPERPYTELRVHPQAGYGRPGWMQVSDYTWGMITNWGVHHIDIAHWGLGIEHAGPQEIEAKAAYPADGLWDVHLAFHVTYRYPDGLTVICTDSLANGVRFEGTEGWVFVSRSDLQTSSASLAAVRMPGAAIRLRRSEDHVGDFLNAVRTRTCPIVDAEAAHRSNAACVLGGIAMRLGRPLRWDARAERFTGDDEANRLLWRPARSPWTP